jgi:hypothetical protein
MRPELTDYDDWKTASPDDLEDALDTWEEREAAREAAADRWVNEHGAEDWR